MGGGQAKVGLQGGRGGFLRDLNALRLDASANYSGFYVRVSEGFKP